MPADKKGAWSYPWRCRCTEPAPDRIGTVRIRRPADEPRCPRCGATQAEYGAEMEEGFDPWGGS
jgi:rubrerythrin